MNHTLRSVVEEELQKAYERGVEDGMKREHAMWQLTAIGQEIEMGITYEEANPPEPYCKRCGKKLGTEAYDVHTCTPKREWVGLTDEDIQGIHYQIKAKGMGAYSTEDIYHAIEAKLKEKNT